MRRHGALTLTFLVCAVVSQLPIHTAAGTTPGATAAPEGNEVQQSARVSTRLTATRVSRGERAWAKGRVNTRSRRPVTLQRRTSAGWSVVARSRTKATGRYRLRVPTSRPGRLRLRIVAPATARYATAKGPVRPVVVKRTYRPAGKASHHKLTRAGWRWDPCRPITYRVNTAGGYPRWQRHLTRAFADVSRASGLTFQRVGNTDRVALRDDPPEGTDVIVSWATPKSVPFLSGGVAAAAWTSGMPTDNGAGEWVRGAVALDSTARLVRGFKPGSHANWGQVMVHEIGHITGLAHTKGRKQTMYALQHGGNQRLGRGDLAGLRKVGASQGCLVPSVRADAEMSAQGEPHDHPGHEEFVQE